MTLIYQDDYVSILHGDCREILDQYDLGPIHSCVTSPPFFGLRDYKGEKQIGREKTWQQYVSIMVGIFNQVRESLHTEGTLWLNLGDKMGPKKQLIGVPWRVAFALQDSGWILRQDIIWHKPNPMPSSTNDRPTTAHEYIHLFSKAERYFYDKDAIAEPALTAGVVVSLGENSFARRQAKGAGKALTGNATADTYTVKETRNKRSVWQVAFQPYNGAHLAVFPEKLIEPCILAGVPLSIPSGEPGTVLDPFAGVGTTGVVAKRFGRQAILIEQNESNCHRAADRISKVSPLVSSNDHASITKLS